MVPLAAGTAADMYLVARVIAGSTVLAAGVSAFLLLVYVGLWFVLPRTRMMRRFMGRS
jgi:phage shock protein PspC (stress-responsive transcriptional regulator)